MPDTFGLDTIPLAPPQGGDDGGGATGGGPLPITDPALKIILDFVTAFLNDDQNATAAWQTPGVSPATKPVQEAFPWNPEDNLFNESSLPALFAWRDGAREEWLADDYLVESTQLKMLWVFPLATPENQAARVNYASSLAKAINVAFERGRTPSWVMPNDPDPIAATAGSFLGTYLGAWAIWCDNWRRTKVVDRGIDGSTNQVYVAIELNFTLQENWSVDTNDPTLYAPTSPDNGVDAIVTNTSGTVMAEGHLASTPKVGTPSGDPDAGGNE